MRDIFKPDFVWRSPSTIMATTEGRIKTVAFLIASISGSTYNLYLNYRWPITTNSMNHLKLELFPLMQFSGRCNLILLILGILWAALSSEARRSTLIWIGILFAALGSLDAFVSAYD